MYYHKNKNGKKSIYDDQYIDRAISFNSPDKQMTAKEFKAWYLGFNKDDSKEYNNSLARRVK